MHQGDRRTGWLELILLSTGEEAAAEVMAGQPVALVEVQVRMDLVLFWQGNRAVAVLARDVLSTWLWNEKPLPALIADDLVLSVEGEARLGLTLDAHVPCYIAQDSLLCLAQLVGRRPSLLRRH